MAKVGVGCTGDQQKAGKSISFAIVVARNAIAIVVASANGATSESHQPLTSTESFT
jgi:hypothetical protein